MRKLEWQQIIQASADPQRAKHGFDQLKATNAAGPLRQASPEEARILAALFSGSQALGQLLLKHPDWLPQTLDAELLRHPRQEQGLRREVDGWLRPLLHSRDYSTALARLRLFKQREMLRIAARDLARLGNATEITREISDVADVCLDAVYQVCRPQFTERFGRERGSAGHVGARDARQVAALFGDAQGFLLAAIAGASNTRQGVDLLLQRADLLRLGAVGEEDLEL